jgi:hypothetical protein
MEDKPTASPATASSPPASASRPTPAPGSAPRKPSGLFEPEEWALVGLGVLSLIGFVLTRYSAGRSFTYWMWVAPLFAVVSLFTGWTRAKRHGESTGEILRTQLLHWSVLPVAIFFVYRLQTTGQLDRQDAGLGMLLAISLTTFLAGVHFDWRLGVLGVALALGAVAAVLIEEYFWVILIVALGAVAVAWWTRRRK